MSLVDPEDPRVADYRDMIHAAQRRDPMGLQPDESVEAWEKRVSFARFMEPFARD